jgi:hypothetical protein
MPLALHKTSAQVAQQQHCMLLVQQQQQQQQYDTPWLG